jgi:hypothetical protein
MGTRIVRIMRIFADHLVALRPLLFDILRIKAASGGVSTQGKK